MGLDTWMAPLGSWLLAGLRDLPVAVARQALYATVLFALFAPLCALLVRRWPHRAAPLRSVLWTLVLLRLVLPPDLATPWSAGAWIDSWLNLGGAGAGFGVEPGLLHPALFEGSAPGVAATTVAPGLSWASLLGLLLWGTAALAVAALFLHRRRGFRELVAGSEAVSETSVLAIADHWRGRLGIRRTVRLVTASSQVAPFTLGSLRPVIFLPAPLLASELQRDGGLEAVIAHEMAHIARWDDLRLLIQRAVQGLWCFHPVAWWAGARLLEERERLCDARVLACGEISPRDYGRSLLAVVRMNLRGTVPWLAPGFPKGKIAMRIREILTEGAHRPRTLPALVAAGTLGLFLLPLAPTSEALDEGGAAVARTAVPGAVVGTGTAVGPGATRSTGAAVGVGRTEGTGEAAARGGAVRVVRAAGVGTAVGVARGSWLLPVPDAKLTSPFGQRVHPMTGEWVLHRGVDLAAPVGKPIYAPAAGLVTLATKRYEGGEHHGTVVVIDHGDGLQSFYSHLDSLSVAAGQHVAPHQLLGTVGTTGEVTGPHLHFEVWQNGEAVDPVLLVAGLDGC